MAFPSSCRATRSLSYRRPCGPCRVLPLTCRLESKTAGLASLWSPRFTLTGPRLTPLSRDTGDVFAVLAVSTGIEPATLTLKGRCSSSELTCTCSDVRLRSFPSLLGRGMRHTACRSPRGLLDRMLRRTSLLRGPCTTDSARRPYLRSSDLLRAYLSRTSLASRYCRAGWHHPDLSMGFGSLARHHQAVEPTFFALRPRPDMDRPWGERSAADGGPVGLHVQSRASQPLGLRRRGRQVSRLSACHHAVFIGHMRPGPNPDNSPTMSSPRYGNLSSPGLAREGKWQRVRESNSLRPDRQSGTQPMSQRAKNNNLVPCAIHR